MSENFTRAISGAVYISLLVAATLYSKTSFEILFIFFLLIGIFEFTKLIKLQLIQSFIIGIIAIIVFYLTRDYNLFFYINFISIGVLSYLLIDLFSNKKHKEIELPKKYLLLIGYIIIPFLAIISLPQIHTTYNPNIIIGILVLFWSNDTFAYIIGKKWGKNKLSENISPKKTIEGFIGGMVFTILAALIIGLYFIQSKTLILAIFALFISFLGPIGDLVESKFKRQANVKDSGNIMPGHGGILDRLDSLIFVAPFLYLIIKILKNYVS